MSETISKITKLILTAITTVLSAIWWLIGFLGDFEWILGKTESTSKAVAVLTSPFFTLTAVLFSIGIFTYCFYDYRKSTRGSKQWYETPENELIRTEAEKESDGEKAPKEIYKDESKIEPKIKANQEKEVRKENASDTKTLKEMFKSDFNTYLLATKEMEITFIDNKTGEASQIKPLAQLMLNFDAQALFIGFYIPKIENPKMIAGIYEHLIQNPNLALSLKESVYVEGGYRNETMTTINELVFTKRVYFYHEDTLVKSDIEKLQGIAETMDFALILRGRGYAFDKNHVRYDMPKRSKDNSQGE